MSMYEIGHARKAAVTVLFGGLLAALPAFAQSTPSGSQLPEGSGKTTVQKICSGCHGAEIVIGRHLTHDGWEQLVASMVEKGANGTDDEFNTVIDYLAKNFGPKQAATANAAAAPKN